ncbi:MAG: isoprenyl transferase [Christensenellales bacterium]
MEEIDYNNLPEHIAIIMDGNRRWAKQRGLEASLGHKEGAENLKRIAKFANSIGIKYMTVYAFSTENWKRTEKEVSAIMKLLKFYLKDFLTSANNDNIKINVIGTDFKLNNEIKEEILKVEEKTLKDTGMTLNIAFNYGGRDEIVNATKKIAEKVKENEMSIEEITEQTIADNIYTAGQPDPDLVIRTSGEQRISNFLLWQIAYSEFVFSNKYWPEFSNEDLLETIKEYQHRTRKFGGK